MLQINFIGLRCHEETDEVGADEPYVIATVVDLRTPGPQVESVVAARFSDVDGAETHNLPSARIIWGVTGKPTSLGNPDDMIAVIALMENDDGDPNVLRGVVKGSAVSSLSSTSGLDRATRVAKLISDINSVLRTPTGAPNFDDPIGPPQELRFTFDELRRANAGERVLKNLIYRGDGGHYTLTFGASSAISLRSNNFPSHFIRHRNALAEISTISSDLDRRDATFRIVPGLADGNLVSLESTNFPDHFLRHQNFELKLHRRGGDQLFRDDATFNVRTGLADPGGMSFESRNFAGFFLRHSNFRVRLDRNDGSELFRRDATFHPVDRLA
jgi:Alpha-L-arabinofuranosidase B (ABFB) domain